MYQKRNNKVGHFVVWAQTKKPTIELMTRARAIPFNVDKRWHMLQYYLWFEK